MPTVKRTRDPGPYAFRVAEQYMFAYCLREFPAFLEQRRAHALAIANVG